MILKVGNRRFTNFSSYSVDLNYNSIASAFALDVKEDLFTNVLKYSHCVLEDEKHGTLITGTILTTTILEKPNPAFSKITGYSKTGVLEDCTVPKDLYPIQYDRLSLLEITRRLVDYFGISLVIRGDKALESANEQIEEKAAETASRTAGSSRSSFVEAVSSPGDELPESEEQIIKSTPDPEEKVKEYLTRVAGEKGILLTHNKFGGLVYERLSEVVGRKIAAKFKPETIGITQMSLNIDAQKLHSEITVMIEPSEENPDATEYTIINPYLPKGVRRPIVKILKSTDNVDLEKAARFELSKELSAIKVIIVGTRFQSPGDLILIQNPKLNLNNPSPFFVEKTNIKGGAKQIDIYTLTCVPADVYATRNPVSPFNQ